MKKRFFSYAIVAITIFSIVSCNKKTEVFSCNESTNTWVKKTRTINQNIARLDLVKFGIDSQFAIFRSLSVLNKRRILFEKVSYMIANYGLSTPEIAHLNKLFVTFLPSFYEENNDEIEGFTEEWVNYAKSTLNWSDQKLTLFVGTWLSDDDIAMLPNVGGGGNYTPDCHCLSDTYCDWMTSNIQPYCKKQGCNLKGGCGIFFTKECKGLCSAVQ